MIKSNYLVQAIKRVTFRAAVSDLGWEFKKDGNILSRDDIKRKEARGIDDYDLGEVHDLDVELVVTRVVDKDKFYLPKNKVVRYDSHKVWFKVTKDEAKAFKKDWSKTILTTILLFPANCI